MSIIKQNLSAVIGVFILVILQQLRMWLIWSYYRAGNMFHKNAITQTLTHIHIHIRYRYKKWLFFLSFKPSQLQRCFAHFYCFNLLCENHGCRRKTFHYSNDGTIHQALNMIHHRIIKSHLSSTDFIHQLTVNSFDKMQQDKKWNERTNNWGTHKESWVMCSRSWDSRKSRRSGRQTL